MVGEPCKQMFSQCAADWNGSPDSVDVEYELTDEFGELDFACFLCSKEVDMTNMEAIGI